MYKLCTPGLGTMAWVLLLRKLRGGGLRVLAAHSGLTGDAEQPIERDTSAPFLPFFLIPTLERKSHVWEREGGYFTARTPSNPRSLQTAKIPTKAFSGGDRKEVEFTKSLKLKFYTFFE